MSILKFSVISLSGEDMVSLKDTQEKSMRKLNHGVWENWNSQKCKNLFKGVSDFCGILGTTEMPLGATAGARWGQGCGPGFVMEASSAQRWREAEQFEPAPSCFKVTVATTLKLHKHPNIHHSWVSPLLQKVCERGYCWFCSIILYYLIAVWYSKLHVCHNVWEKSHVLPWCFVPEHFDKMVACVEKVLEILKPVIVLCNPIS